jgi:modification methylase
VAKRLGRRWIGIEREPQYIRVARERIAAALPLDESAMTVMPSKRTAQRVPFGALVEAGMLAPGTRLTDARRRWHASVRADSSLGCEQGSGSIHKLGALLQGAPSCNGWTFWHVEREGRLEPIDMIRQEWLAMQPAG